MKRLALALSVTCLAVVAIVAAWAILSDAGGVESAGPVPSSSSVREATPGERAALDADISVKALAGVPKVDYLIDLHDGGTIALPDSIVRRVRKPSEGRPYPLWAARYAATRDGSQLAYVGTGDEGSLQIFIADIYGEEVRQVTHDPRGATFPAWSPDATKIAYNASGRLFVLDVETGKSRPLPNTGRLDRWSGLQFTPDGSSLLYSRPVESGFSELRTVPTTEGRARSSSVGTKASKWATVRCLPTARS